MIGGQCRLGVRASSAAPAGGGSWPASNFSAMYKRVLDIHQAPSAKSIGGNDKTTRKTKPEEKVFIVVADTHPKQLVKCMKEHTFQIEWLRF
jgi:hypothetical protein